jgi:hypothetical protein
MLRKVTGMRREKCDSCEHLFKIDNKVRSHDGIFFTLFPKSSLFDWIDEYFVVACPNCGHRQHSKNIRMFGFISKKYASLSILAFIFSWIILFAILDKFHILKNKLHINYRSSLPLSCAQATTVSVRRFLTPTHFRNSGI